MFVRTALLSCAIAVAIAAAASGHAAPAAGSGNTAVTVTADVGVPGPPSGLRLVTRRGQSVTLGWTAPSTGAAVIGYVIEGGLAPAEVLGSVPTTGTATTFTFDAPVGAFFVRVHAVGENGRSVASNEVPLVVSGAVALAPPSAPAALLGLADGTTLGLSWTSTLVGGEPARLWLQVSGSLSGALPVPAGEVFRFDGVPPGTYTFSLIAENDAGASAPSNAVTLTFPAACTGAPNPPTAFRSWQEGGAVSIAWDPPQSGAAVDRYTVHVEGDLRLSFDTTERLVSAPLPAGQYAVRVEAVNACGRSVGAPAGPDWAVAVRSGTSHTVHWKARLGVDRYRIFWSTSRDSLEPLAPSAAFVDATTSPVILPAAAPSEPLYYRVFDADGAVLAGASPVAVAPGFAAVDSERWSGDVTPGLWDVDGDGCLDLVGGWGNCDGSFRGYDLDTLGLFGLRANGRANRDSRFADFTGDGIVDVFSNIYDRADTAAFASMLHIGNGQGGFAEDPGVAAMQVRGFGETIVAADFDNDGDVDLFLPHYTHLNDGGRNLLLMNDGQGHFTDIASSAGVAANLHVPPEGAQAVDINQDGWLDIHVASHLFMNNGDLTFTDIAGTLDMPVRFEEGMRLFDVDLDGDLDLIHHDTAVTRLYTNDGLAFDEGVAVHGADDGATFGYGLNVCDVNGDGFEDVLVAYNSRQTLSGLPALLLNVGGRLTPSALSGATPVYHDLMACADLDGSGLPDPLHRWTESTTGPNAEPALYPRFRSFVTRGTAGGTIRLRITDADGARNQQGRPVRLRPRQGPDVSLLRMVESGSGYMAQNGYDLLVAAPWPGDYDVEVRYAGGWVRTTARPGDVLTIRADGTVVAGLQ